MNHRFILLAIPFLMIMGCTKVGAGLTDTGNEPEQPESTEPTPGVINHAGLAYV